MTIYLRQSTASQEVALGFFVDSTDGNTEETGLTIAAADIRLHKAGGTTLTTPAAGATHISNGIYYWVADATDTNTLGSMAIYCHPAGALALKVECVVLSANVYDSLIAGTDLFDVSTTQLSGQTVTAGAGVTFPTSVASPTNITAGTITTVTNLTNAPTAGDFTATMKTSIGTAVAASAVASVTGAVGSVTGLTNATIADQVWDEILSGHVVSGSTGEALGAIGDPWITALPGAYSAGQAGYILGTNLNATVSSRLASAGYTAPLDAAATRSAVGMASANLDTQIGTLATASNLAVVAGYLDTEIAAIKAVTDALPNAGALTTIQADLDDIQTRIPAALSSGNMKVDVLALNGDATSAANIAKTTRAIARITASGTPTTTSIPTSAITPAVTVADQLKGRILTWDADTTTAALRGQATDITANTSGGVLTVTALTTAPASGDTGSVT